MGPALSPTGGASAFVGETITEPLRPQILPLMGIEEPTVKMQFIANNGPFCGKEGKYVPSRNLLERLTKELKSNVALRVVGGFQIPVAS